MICSLAAALCKHSLQMEDESTLWLDGGSKIIADNSSDIEVQIAHMLVRYHWHHVCMHFLALAMSPHCHSNF